MSLFDDIITFVTAADVQSFSGAAKNLSVAKSIVSRRIKSLEDRLGTSLFNRTTRQLSLTETGQAYYERARRIVAELAEAEDVARSLHGTLRGKLRVAAPTCFGVRHLSLAIAEFLSSHPQLEIELDLDDRHVDLVGEGYDVAVRIGSLPDSSLIARTLAPCRHVVCASPVYLAARGEPRSPADLVKQAHDCLVYSNRSISEQWRFRSAAAGEWQELRVTAQRLSVNNGEVLRDAVIAGLGLAVLPTFAVGDALEAGQLRIVLREYEFFNSSIHAVWPPNRKLSAKARAFVDFLCARFDGLPYWDGVIAKLAA
jgi:DNA-binding transcriptional LysR family regulator